MKKEKTKKIKKKKNIFQKLTILFIVVSILALVGIGALYFVNYKLDSYSVILSGDQEEVEIQKKTKISALVCGINEYLTDTIIYVTADLETGKIAYMSIPRDTYITNSYAIGHKINSIYRYINIEPLVNQVESMLDVNIDYYLVVDNDVVVELVDAIGGVEFDVPMRMLYDDNNQDLHIDLQEGLQLLNGDQAEQLIRFRQNNDGTGYFYGDIQRVEVQQDFIKAFLNQAASAENLLNINEIVSIALTNTDTNVTIREALQYVTDIANMDLENIYTCTAEGTTPYIDGISYFVMDEEATQEIIKNEF